MGKYDDVKKEIEVLVSEGAKMLSGVAKDAEKKQINTYFLNHYESWYTKSLYIVQQLASERKGDFVACYKLQKRSGLSCSTYLISDMLQGVGNPEWFGKVAYLLSDQLRILESCNERFDSKIYDLEMLLQADVFDSEIESAKHLLKNGFLRAAGAICGVILEKHLAKVCNDRGITILKKDPAIGDYNEKLKDVAYDTIEWRKMQGLADIRNLCDHKKDRDPTTEEVKDLISGTERVIKSIF